MKKFLVYIDDDFDVYKLGVPAKNATEAVDFAKGNGEIIAVKEVSELYPISLEKVSEALKDYNFGKIEIDFILRTLSITGIAE